MSELCGILIYLAVSFMGVVLIRRYYGGPDKTALEVWTFVAWPCVAFLWAGICIIAFLDAAIAFCARKLP